MTSRPTLILIAVSISACGWLRKNDDENSGRRSSSDLQGLQFTGGIRYFDSCEEIQGKVRSILEAKKTNDREQLQFSRQQQHNKDYDEYDNDEFVESNTAGSAPAQEASSPSPASDSQNGGAKSDRENGSDIQTNLQEAEVDESDFIKANEHHLYSYDNDQIQVVDRDTLDYLGDLSTGSLENVTLFTDEDLLIVIGSKEKSRTICSKSDDNERRCHTVDDAETEVRVYRSRPGKLPKKSYEFEIVGTYDEARMIDGELILVSQDGIQINYGKAGEDPLEPVKDPETNDDEKKQFIYSKFGRSGAPANSQGPSPVANPVANNLPSRGDTGPNLATHKIAEEPVGLDEGNKEVWGVKCNQIIKPPVDDIDFNLLKVTRISIRDEDSIPQVVGSLGSGDIIYATNRSVYTTKQGTKWMPWSDTSKYTTEKDHSDRTLAMQRVKDQLAIYKVDLSDDETLQFSGSAILDGRLKDRWALKEYDKGTNLAVATTTGVLNGEDDLEARNHLFALQHQGANLTTASAIRDFGENEDIRAIRYIGDVAYIVTFRQTDPLFAFDLSDPTDITLLGELKIPGFSTYLHPISSSRMVGVGYNTNGEDDSETAFYQGIQVSLFDIDNPEDLERIDNTVHGGRGSHSEVTANSKAFYFDEDHEIFAIPVVESSASGRGNVGIPFDEGRLTGQVSSGAVFYGVKDDELNSLGWATHAELIPAGCRHLLSSFSGWQAENRSIDVNRIFKLDGRVLSISRWGIKEHTVSQDGVSEVTATVFSDKDSSDICTAIKEPIILID